MGLKEEMTGDIDQFASTREPKSKADKKPKVDEKTVHLHGDGRCEESWLDEDNRRRVRPAQGRVPRYLYTCKACQTEDAKRMAAEPTIQDDDVENFVFMVPERTYDQQVAAAYLAKRYPGKELLLLSDIRPARMAMHPGAKIVIVTRRPLPGTPGVGPSVTYQEDRMGNTLEKQIQPETYINEIVESAPVVVADHVKATAGTMFSDGQVDMTDLCATLCELAAPRYFIAQYKRVVNSDEIVFTMRTLG